MHDAVLLQVNGSVAHLVLNQPAKHNALRFADLDMLVRLLHEAEDDDVKVVILRGNGPSLCAGHDDAARSRTGPRAWPGTPGTPS